MPDTVGEGYKSQERGDDPLRATQQKGEGSWMVGSPPASQAHPLLFLLHPAILLVGAQFPWKPQVLEWVREGALQYLLQHVAAGRQQAFQGGPHD